MGSSNVNHNNKNDSTLQFASQELRLVLQELQNKGYNTVQDLNLKKKMTNSNNNNNNNQMMMQTIREQVEEYAGKLRVLNDRTVVVPAAFADTRWRLAYTTAKIGSTLPPHSTVVLKFDTTTQHDDDDDDDDDDASVVVDYGLRFDRGWLRSIQAVQSPCILQHDDKKTLSIRLGSVVVDMAGFAANLGGVLDQWVTQGRQIVMQTAYRDDNVWIVTGEDDNDVDDSVDSFSVYVREDNND